MKKKRDPKNCKMPRVLNDAVSKRTSCLQGKQSNGNTTNGSHDTSTEVGSGAFSRSRRGDAVDGGGRGLGGGEDGRGGGRLADRGGRVVRHGGRGGGVEHAGRGGGRRGRGRESDGLDALGHGHGDGRVTVALGSLDVEGERVLEDLGVGGVGDGETVLGVLAELGVNIPRVLASGVVDASYMKND